MQSKPGAPNTNNIGPIWPATDHDNLLLPSGARVGACPSHQLFTEFHRLKIPGFNHTLGRQTAIEKYAAHIAAIGKAGRDSAVAKWLGENK